jgi:hypothetical protein
MGELIDRIGLRMLVDGDGLVDNFKNNSNYFYEKFTKSEKDVPAVSPKDIKVGMFYHFHYLDNSNWMKWSPVFVADFKKVGTLTIILAVNFNFIPLEVRARIFDKFIIEDNFEKNIPLKVNYKGIYQELLKVGFEYSIVEYDVRLLKLIHRIDMNMLPRFLISQHPKNKYDPKALINIWKVKLKDKDKRNREIMNSTLDEFYDFRGDISEKYDVLEKHIQRIQANQKKYGNL